MAVIDAARKTDWTGAGCGTIPTRTTIYTTLNPGATQAEVNTAIANCPDGQVVQLAAGTFDIYGLTIGRSNITLRGMGAKRTFLNFLGPESCVGPWSSICVKGPAQPNVDFPAPVVDWTAGYAKGATVATLSDASSFAVGDMMVLDQLADGSTDTGEIWDNQSNACLSCSPVGRSGANRPTQQWVEIISKAGNNVTFSPGLHFPNWRSGQSPQAWRIPSPTEGVGIENMSINSQATPPTGQTAIAFYNCRKCWVKGVRSLYGIRNHVWLFQSAKITVRDSYFYGSPGSSQSYGVECWMGSDHLIENNIFHHIASPQMNAATSGTVWGYNYAIDDDYQTPPTWQQSSSYFHTAGVNNVLFEGNDGIGFTADNEHGTSNLGTMFRNRFVGKESGKTAQTSCILCYACNRYMNVVGNVLGDPAHHTNYECFPANASDAGVAGVADVSIFSIGWSGNQGSKASSLPNDTLVRSTMMRWGNYDVKNATVRWENGEVPSGLSILPNPVPPDHVLPASYYKGTSPDAFPVLNVPWPPIGPDVTGGNIPGLGGYAHKIPARLAYEQGTFTSGILDFDAEFYDQIAAGPILMGQGCC